MRLALFQPDIPQNTGTLIRLGACLGVAVDIIGPCGFPVSDRSLKRAALDYADMAEVCHHRSWSAFLSAPARDTGRLILLTTKARRRYTQARFGPEDTLLLGSESAGVPRYVHDAADSRIRIQMREGLRSLNVAVAAAIVLGEALRQTDGFPAPPDTGPTRGTTS